MRRSWYLLSVVAVLFVTRIVPAAPHATSAPVKSDQVVEYLNRMIDWYHRVETLDPGAATSQELLLRASVRDNMRQAVKLGLQFGRAEAAMPDVATAATNPSTRAAPGAAGRNLTQLANNAAARVQQLQSQLTQLDQEIQSASATSRPALSDGRDRLTAQLNLATAQQQVLSEYSGFVAAAQAGESTSLGTKIDALERSVPKR